MATEEAKRLIALVNEKMGALSEACQGVDEETAARAPEGRWSPRMILTHITGPDGSGFLAGIKRFIAEETPRIDIVPEDPYLTERRSALSFRALLAEAVQEHAGINDYLATLTDEQLQRKAHVPLLKESPLGEYPTLAVWIQAMAEYHLSFHIDHLKEILQALRK